MKSILDYSFAICMIVGLFLLSGCGGSKGGNGSYDLSSKEAQKIIDRELDHARWKNPTYLIRQNDIQARNGNVPLFRLASFYQRVGKNQRALEYFNLLSNQDNTSLDLNSPEWRLLYARALWNSGNKTLAEAQYAKAQDIQASRQANQINRELSTKTDALQLMPSAVVNSTLFYQGQNDGAVFAPTFISRSHLMYSELIDDGTESIPSTTTVSILSRTDEEKGPEGISQALPSFGNGLVEKVVLSGSNNCYYFSKCITQNGQSRCRIYRSADGERPVLILGGVNLIGSSNHSPSLGSHLGKDVLFFSSNRSGGKGGMDIWYSIQDSANSFRAPVNVDAINTQSDEITPHFDNPSSLLFFSSDGHAPLGGFDISRVSFSISSNQSSNHQIFGSTINSTYDDAYFIWEGNSKEAFWTSNRTRVTSGVEREGYSAIYKTNFEFNSSLERGSGLGPVSIVGTIKGNSTKRAPTQTEVRVFRLVDADEVLVKTFNASGERQFEIKLERGGAYKFVFIAKGFSLLEKNISTKGSERFLKMNVRMREDLPFLSGKVYSKSGNELRVLTGVQIDVLERDKEGRAKQVGSVTSNSDGYAVELNEGRIFTVTARMSGFKVFTTALIVKGKGSAASKVEDIIMEREVVHQQQNPQVQGSMFSDISQNVPVPLGVSFVGETATLNDNSFFVLFEVGRMLRENPTRVIEIRSHTSSKKSADFNKKLSGRRAAIVQEYLAGVGISTSRIIASGMGKEYPLDPANPALNDRMEMVLINY